MRRRSQRAGKKTARTKTKLGLPDLDQAKAAVLSTLRSPESQRGYRYAIDEFIWWYCSEPPERRTVLEGLSWRPIGVFSRVMEGQKTNSGLVGRNLLTGAGKHLTGAGP